MKKLFLLLSLVIGVFVIILVTASLMTNLRPTNSYSVDKSEVELEYSSYHDRDKDKKVEFTTVLYAKDKPGSESDDYIYKEALAHISHLKKVNSGDVGSENANTWESRIEIKVNSNKNVKFDLKKDSLQLRHKTESGELLQPLSVKPSLDNCVNTENKYMFCSYSQTYDLPNPPDTLNEFIYLEFVIDGETQVIEKEFPIHLN